ncbi:hypothetical protein CROQUDRAFT_111241 [Cronartium quercuum f. sp. fusiforme G11]|uniref:Serine aminopeptidase S33 domain-containing protein n=1 Tax=Cronartium quercuum f. sp. fusiforme G11 TaxID=708437 RepID=A0A9P6T5X3_9BASI|nr:hypothetical protein CROQUDRAFT_111241 [Cronartium quercuum f. sp. fusiforme G11]
MSFTSRAEWQDGPSGISFFTKRWIPSESPTVAKLIFIHGFVEHILRYDHVYSRYAEAGIEVFAFDQRGFGQTAAKTHTEGQTSWAEGLSDIEFFIKQEANVSTKVFLMGHSMALRIPQINKQTHTRVLHDLTVPPHLSQSHHACVPRKKGGGLAFAYFTRPVPLPSSSLITGGLVLSSPLIAQTPGVATPNLILRLGSFVGAVLPKLTLKVGLEPKDISRDPVVQEQYAHDPLCAPIGTVKGIADMIIGGKGLLDKDYQRFPSQLPLLAVHGTGDKITYYVATKNLVEKTNAKDKTFKEFEGFYHEMHNEPGNDKIEEMDYIINWIKAHI